MPQWLLELRSGVRVKLGRGPTSIGRSSRCDIVVPDPAVSRRQALLLPKADVLEVVNVGKRPMQIDGEAFTDLGHARDGSAIHIADCPVAVVRRGQASRERSDHTRFFLSVGDGPLLPVPDTPCTAGGTADDDIVVAGWPTAALEFHPAEDGVVVEADTNFVPLRTDPFDEDGFARLGAGESLEVGDVTVSLVVADGLGLERTTRSDRRRVVALARFRSGGMLSVRCGSATTSVYLPLRRYALVRALLTPAQAAVGYHRADALCRQIWPDDASKDITDFNVLLHRVRRDLIRGGLDTAEWFDRKRGSGMIRAPIATAPDVDFDIEEA